MLIKEELRGIPLLPPPKYPAVHYRVNNLTAVELVELPRSGVVLVADVYKDKGEKLKARFFTDGEIYYTCISWPAKTWGKSNPAVDYWSENRNFSYASDTKLAEQFLHRKERDSWRTQGALAVIDAFISDQQSEKKHRAEENKAALQARHFAMFPQLPEDLPEYCEEQVFDHSYIFFDKLTKTGRRYGRCGRCGEKYRLPKDVKHNAETKCPRCGSPALYKAAWRQTAVEDKAKICVTAKVDGQLLIRWMSVRRGHTDKKFSRTYSFSDYAYNLYLTDKKGKQTLYAYEWKPVPYCDTHAWKRWPNWSQNFSTTYVYTNNLDTVFGNSYYNVDLKAGLAGKRLQLCFTSLLNNLKKYPAAEYLFKLNIPILAAETGNLMCGKKKTKPGFTEVLGISKQFLPMYSSMSVSYDEHRVIKSYGQWVSPEDLADYRRLRCTGGDVYDVIEMLKTMSFGKFVRYFNKQRTATRKTIHFLMIQYRDYISMAQEMKIDLSRKTVRYPVNICEAHDAVLDEFNRLKFEKENKAFVKAVKVLYEKLPVREFKNDKFCIVLPQLRSDLVTEGKSLKHCVGGINYAEKHMKGTSMIFFVRRIENRDKPFFTMEVNMQYRQIVQIHGFGNCSAPPDVRKFAENFVKALKPAEKNE